VSAATTAADAAPTGMARRQPGVEPASAQVATPDDPDGRACGRGGGGGKEDGQSPEDAMESSGEARVDIGGGSRVHAGQTSRHACGTQDACRVTTSQTKTTSAAAVAAMASPQRKTTAPTTTPEVARAHAHPALPPPVPAAGGARPPPPPPCIDPPPTRNGPTRAWRPESPLPTGGGRRATGRAAAGCAQATRPRRPAAAAGGGPCRWGHPGAGAHVPSAGCGRQGASGRRRAGG